MSGPRTAGRQSLSSVERMPVAAFFDVDNTLVPGPAIELRFFRHLLLHRQVGSRETVRSLWHLIRQTPVLSLQPLRERKLYLEGKQPSIIEPLAAAFVRRTICPRLSSSALAAIEWHRSAGHDLVLVTASLDFLIAPLADHLQIALVLAATPDRISDRYTGHIVPPLPYGDGKRTLIEQLSAQRGLDLRYSYAYGDSPGDIATLRSVGYPVVINPIRGMKRVASREGWPVERWA